MREDIMEIHGTKTSDKGTTNTAFGKHAGIRIGVDYYPEHWDRALWEQDADQMKEAGVQIVRMAEFAWSRLEPQEGVYDFSWLDQAIQLFADRGIWVFLCTPTSTPPQWLFAKYSEVIQVDKTGHPVKIGIRGHRCMTSPVYRRLAQKMIEAMVSHYADYPAVIGYQIDNELESNHCCCPVCQEAFQNWVREKYHTIDAVNAAWGNSVWSGEYTQFDQILPPFGEHQNWLNPSMTLDFNRYASDSTVDYVRFQMDCIRRIAPDTQITTNCWLCENMPDFYDMFADLDFVSYDNYPVSRLPENGDVLYSHSFHLDLMRGIRQDNFWIMEQLSGSVGSWMPMSSTPRPGMIKGYALQAIAHGADAVLHFRWRTATTGAEMFWHGILDHSNVPGRRYQEFCDLCHTVAQLDGLEQTQVCNQVALLYSSDQEYAFKLQPQVDGMYYMEQLKYLHDGFTAMGVGVDIINQTSDISAYKIVLAPTLFVTNPVVVEHLQTFVAQGGILLLTNRSGVKDMQNRCIMDALPTTFRSLMGAGVTEYDPIGNMEQKVKFTEDKWQQAHADICSVQEKQGHSIESEATCTQWCDLIVPAGAEVVMTYEEAFYQGTAAMTRNHYEKGLAYYLGTVVNRGMYMTIAQELLDEGQIPYQKDIPLGLEITHRVSEKDDWTFYFNNTETALKYRQWLFHPFEMKITKNHQLVK